MHTLLNIFMQKSDTPFWSVTLDMVTIQSTVQFYAFDQSCKKALLWCLHRNITKCDSVYKQKHNPNK